MADPAAYLDGLPEADARTALARCCGAPRWVDGMLARRPFQTREALLAAADDVWSQLGRDDYLAAFAHHPRIGEQPATKHEATAQWSRAEQRGMESADERTRDRLAALNRAYERRFGYLYLVCATGKTADELLGLLEARLMHAPDHELAVAAGEQAKITRLRLEKLA